MIYSVSQIKTFCGSKAKWAWKYILWIEDDFEKNDSLILWKMFEYWLMNWKDNIEEIIWDQEVVDMEKLIEDYETLKHNAQWLAFERWVSNYKVEWDLLWQKFVWYIDNITEIYIDDIKTARYLSKEDWGINMWSWMSTNDEYKLQLRVYMKLLGRNKSRIIEIAKHKYKDERNEHQIIEFELTPEFDKEMTEKYQPVINEMSNLYKKHKI